MYLLQGLLARDDLFYNLARLLLSGGPNYLVTFSLLSEAAQTCLLHSLDLLAQSLIKVRLPQQLLRVCLNR